MLNSRLQYISQGDTLKDQERSILRVLDAGGDWIQIRWKQDTDPAFTHFCAHICQRCHDYHAICIINDHVGVARQMDADGVHLGLEDHDIATARDLLPSGKIIGGTANTIAHVSQRIFEKCDYIGVGPYRFTQTKKKLSPVLGLHGYARILDYFRTAQVNLPPIFAIGGIELADIAPLKTIGLHGVALSGLLTGQPTLIRQINKILA